MVTSFGGVMGSPMSVARELFDDTDFSVIAFANEGV